MTNFILDGRTCWVQDFQSSGPASSGPALAGCPEQSMPLILLFAGDFSSPLITELRELLLPKLEKGICPSFFLAGSGPVDWDRDYTPWPTDDTKGRVFSGEADQAIPFLTELLIPELRRRFPSIGPVYTAGYSLGGLAALYYHTQIGFSGCASCSGSFWYPGWTAYLNEHLPRGRIYLSLGGKEKNTRHPLMCRIEEETRAVSLLLKDSAGAVTFVHEPGGHSHQIPQRIANAISWLLLGC